MTSLSVTSGVAITLEYFWADAPSEIVLVDALVVRKLQLGQELQLFAPLDPENSPGI